MSEQLKDRVDTLEKEVYALKQILSAVAETADDNATLLEAVVLDLDDFRSWVRRRFARLSVPARKGWQFADVD